MLKKLALATIVAVAATGVAVAQEKIKLGVVVTLSGPAAALGQQVRDGFALAVKDLGFALGFGREFGVPLDLASQAMQTFIRARSTYGGQAWSSQVVKLLEDATGTDLRAPGFPAEL